MQVISGKAKGHKLKAVPGEGTRPILDRTKTALFDSIIEYIQDLDFLDLFGGSGAVGIEALSQGAKSCQFCEISIPALNTIRANLKHTKLEQYAITTKVDAFRFIERCAKSYGIIYNAPPQYKGIWLKVLKAIDKHPKMMTDDAWVITQIDPKEVDPDELKKVEFKHLVEIDQKKMGNTLFITHGKMPA